MKIQAKNISRQLRVFSNKLWEMILLKLCSPLDPKSTIKYLFQNPLTIKSHHKRNQKNVANPRLYQERMRGERINPHLGLFLTNVTPLK